MTACLVDRIPSAHNCLRVERCVRGDIVTPHANQWVTKARTADMRIARIDEGLVLHSYCGSRARVTYEPWAIHVARAPSISQTRFNHTVMHGFIPNALALRGHIVLHAACVQIDERAVLFAGEGGAGKSSIAAGFLKRGYRVLSEDIVVIQPDDTGLVAQQSYPGARLRSDSFLLDQPRARRPDARFGLPKHRISSSPSHAHIAGASNSSEHAPVRVLAALFLQRGRTATANFEPMTNLDLLHKTLAAGFVSAISPEQFERHWLTELARTVGSMKAATLRYKKSARHFDQLLDDIVNFCERETAIEAIQ